MGISTSTVLRPRLRAMTGQGAEVSLWPGRVAPDRAAAAKFGQPRAAARRAVQAVSHLRVAIHQSTWNRSEGRPAFRPSRISPYRSGQIGRADRAQLGDIQLRVACQQRVIRPSDQVQPLAEHMLTLVRFSA